MTELDFTRIGRAQELLVSRRVIRSAVEDGRPNEADLECADILTGLTDDERDALTGLLSAQGWNLNEFDDTMPGVPRRARQWMVVRRPDAGSPCLMTMEPVWQRVALRKDESKAVTVYWVTFLWLTTLSFMYERIERSVSEVSEYIRAVLDRDELEERVEARIEEIRSSGAVGAGTRLPIAEALIGNGSESSTRKQDIRRRVRNFLDCMKDARMIEPLRSEENTYRQTLVCAVQLRDLYAHGLIHIVPPDRVLQEMDERLAADNTVMAGGI